MLKSNLVAVRKLGKLAGKASHFASMIYVWRRFLAELWGALQESENPQAQGMHQKDAYGLDKLNLHSCGPQPSCLGDQGHGECVQKIVVPVCVLWEMPRFFWLGAYLTVNGKVVSGYASDTSREDEKILDIRRGDEKCQQVVESLNLLVALRTWKKFWGQERVSLEVRSDNIAALTLLLNLKGSSKALNRVGRELAFVMHTLGWHRLLQTCCLGNSATLSELKDVPEISPATRDTSWWTTAEAIWSNQGLSSPLVLVRAPCDVLCSSFAPVEIIIRGPCSSCVQQVLEICRLRSRPCVGCRSSRPCVGDSHHGLLSGTFPVLLSNGALTALCPVVFTALCRLFSRPCVGGFHALYR